MGRPSPPNRKNGTSSTLKAVTAVTPEGQHQNVPELEKQAGYILVLGAIERTRGISGFRDFYGLGKIGCFRNSICH